MFEGTNSVNVLAHELDSHVVMLYRKCTKTLTVENFFVIFFCVGKYGRQLLALACSPDGALLHGASGEEQSVNEVCVCVCVCVCV